MKKYIYSERGRDRKKKRAWNKINPDVSVLSSTLESESSARRSKLTKFASDHIFSHIECNVLLAVVDLESDADETGQDRARTGVGANGDLLFGGFAQRKRNNVRT